MLDYFPLMSADSSSKSTMQNGPLLSNRIQFKPWIVTPHSPLVHNPFIFHSNLIKFYDNKIKREREQSEMALTSSRYLIIFFVEIFL